MRSPASDADGLKRAPLDALHRERGARMASFAGYEMPIQYPIGVLKEHLHTRELAGLFDVSHMGQIALRLRSGGMAALVTDLESLVPVDVLGLAPGRQRYAFFVNSQGGLIDDLMIANCGDHFLLVVNASRKAADEQLLRSVLSAVCDIELLSDRGLLAVQGPAAESVLTRLSGAAAAMQFMEIRTIVLAGISCIVSRSGYTGEDGFEISVPADEAETLARLLLKHPDLALAGLGARDSLRLEAGLCLYGADLDETTTPAEAGLAWVVQRVRRRGGARAGGFPGADIVLAEFEGQPRRFRVGLRPRERAPVRGGTYLFASISASEPVGHVTSGGYGPSVGAPIGMGYVVREHASPHTQLFAEVRGNRMPVTVAVLPFIPHRYKRS